MFPAYGEAVPTLSQFQLSFQGYKFGAGTNLELTKLEGIDLPTVRTGDAGRPRDHGMFVGLDVMGAREITVTGQLYSKSGNFQEAWEQLAAATIPGGTTQYPLFMNLPGYGTLASLVRVRKRSIPVDIKFALGNLADVALLFAASDPRWYVTPTKSASVTPPSKTSGFSFPLSFPLSFGGGSLAGSLSVSNTGNIETRPLLIVEGPCTNPSITNDSAPGSPNLTFDLVMPAGSKLEIDTDMHTATYYSPNSTIGTSRIATLAPGSQWFVLEPGTSTIQFLVGSGEGELTVIWASALVI